MMEYFGWKPDLSVNELCLILVSFFRYSKMLDVRSAVADSINM